MAHREIRVHRVDHLQVALGALITPLSRVPRQAAVIPRPPLANYATTAVRSRVKPLLALAVRHNVTSVVPVAVRLVPIRANPVVVAIILARKLAIRARLSRDATVTRDTVKRWDTHTLILPIHNRASPRRMAVANLPLRPRRVRAQFTCLVVLERVPVVRKGALATRLIPIQLRISRISPRIASTRSVPRNATVARAMSTAELHPDHCPIRVQYRLRSITSLAVRSRIVRQTSLAPCPIIIPIAVAINRVICKGVRLEKNEGGGTHSPC